MGNALRAIQRLSPVGDAHASVNQLIESVRVAFPGLGVTHVAGA